VTNIASTIFPICPSGVRCARSPRRMPPPGPGPLSGTRYRRHLLPGLIALFAGFVPVTGIAQPNISASAQADQGIETLLRQVERQITIGHIQAPEGDNAMATWRHVLETVLPASPETTRALTDFAAYARSRANEEQAAGRIVAASDLLVFADEATRLLPRESTTSASSSAAAQSIAPAGSVPDAVPLTSPAGMATYDARRSEAPNGSAPSAVPADTRRTMIDPAQTQIPNVGSDRTNASLASELHNKEATMPAPAAGKTANLAPHPPATTPTTQQQAAAALRRGDAMLAIQDISAARLFYEYAANAGSARAAMALAETYDPTFLPQLGAVGTRPNPPIAAEWYRKAAALGSRSAEARLQTLGVEAAR
jgi:hypothetical protein